MTAAREDLRITSDALLRDIEALIALEERKRDIPLDDPEVAELARQIQGIAQRVLAASRRQKGLTGEVTASAGAGGEAASAPTINETPRSVASILSEWRDLERRAAAAEAGSAERAEIEVLAERLREEYRRAVDAPQTGIDPGFVPRDGAGGPCALRLESPHQRAWLREMGVIPGHVHLL